MMTIERRLFGPRQRAVLRVLGYGVAVTSLAVFGLARYGVAKAGETSLTVGRELYELHDLLDRGEKVEINGETMYFTAQATDQSMDVVLDRVARYCDGHPNAVDPLFAKAPPGKGPAGLGVVKRLGPNDGTVSCLAKGSVSPEGLAPALKAFADTGNLGELGMMRYVYVRKPDSGVGAQVMAAWTDQKFNMNAFMPPPGVDAPGSDANLAPRPPGSIRRYSARLGAGAYAATMYRTSMSREEIIAFYDKEMLGSGWFASKDPVDTKVAGTDKVSNGKLYIKAPDLSVLVSITADGDERLVNLVEGTSPIKREIAPLR